MQNHIMQLALWAFIFVAGAVLGLAFFCETKVEQLVISQAISVEHKLAPETFTAQISVESTKKLEQTPALSAQEENALVELLQANNALVVQAKEVCVGGEFGIETRTYEDRRLINGKWSYIERTGIFVRQGIACEFTKEQAKIYEDLLNALRVNVAKSPYLRFNLPAITPIYTQEQIRAKTQTMRNEILAQAKQITKDYSKILSTKCHITSLRFSDRNNTPQVAYKSSAPLGSNANAKYSSSAHEDTLEAIQVADSLPVVKDGELQLSADFSIGCK